MQERLDGVAEDSFCHGWSWSRGPAEAQDAIEFPPRPDSADAL